MGHNELPAAVTEAAFPADPDFPQLEAASDPRRMLAVFRAHLTPAGGERRIYRIESCVPVRFRCRQSTTRCVLQYLLRIVEPSTGRRWQQWVTGLIYAEAGAAERLWRELVADEARVIPDSWRTFEPVSFVPDLQMVLQVFPYDRRLPNLARVLSGALNGREPLLLARFGPGIWHPTGQSLTPTRYRTELGAALQWTIQARDRLTSRTAEQRCYLKVYRDHHGTDTFGLLRAWADRGRNRNPGYSVVEPIAYFDDLRTLVLEEAPGTTLQQVLLQHRETIAALRAVARAIAALNTDDLAITGRHSRADQIADVKRAASLLVWACPEVKEAVRETVAAVVDGLPEVPSAPIHRDLKPDHIFVADGRVIFIDLDSVALGDPVRDPAHLYAHLRARVGMDGLQPDRARVAATALIDEYVDCVPPSWRQRLPLHCAGALIEVAGGIFKRQEPWWRAKVKAAVAAAQSALDGIL